MLNHYKIFIETYYDKKLSMDENMRRLISMSHSNIDANIVAKYLTGLQSR